MSSNNQDEISRGDKVFCDLTHIGSRPGVAGVVKEVDPNSPHDYKVRTDEGIISLMSYRVSKYNPTKEDVQN